MKLFRVIAIGHEQYWLQMVKKAIDETQVIDASCCFNTIDEFLNFSQETNLVTLLLVNIFEQTAVKTTVQKLREMGWQYVVVVAADPSVNDVYSVLHDAGGYDYWRKTYQSPIIRAQIENFLDEIKITCRAEDIHE